MQLSKYMSLNTVPLHGFLTNQALEQCVFLHQVPIGQYEPGPILHDYLVFLVFLPFPTKIHREKLRGQAVSFDRIRAFGTGSSWGPPG